MTIGLTTLCVLGSAFAAEPSPAPAASVAADSSVSMPSVRRVGILPVGTNIEAFRKFMKTDARSLGGFPALPLTESEVSDELTKIVGRAMRDSGRFWSLSMDVTIDLLRRGTSSGDFSEAKSRLERRYDLDAWLVPEVLFEPDHTRVRIAMMSTQTQNFTLAREDITVSHSPTTLDLDSAIHSALAKMQTTLGHDGRVTWSRDDLLVVDFGKERGLTTGSKLSAGYVLLSAWHPASREFFRSKKLKTMDLTVVEARQGSALCKVSRRDRVAEDELKTVAPDIAKRESLLVWRSQPIAVDATKTEPGSDSMQTALVGEGFGKGEVMPDSKLKKPDASKKPEAKPVEAKPVEAKPVEAKPTSAPLVAVDVPGVEAEPRPVPLPDEEPARETGGAVLSDPETWQLAEMSLGAGFSIAVLSGTTATASTGFPLTLVNAIRMDSVVQVDRDMFLAPGAALQFYGFGDATGYKFDVEAPILLRVLGDERGTLPSGTIEVGGGIGLTAGVVDGEVKTQNSSVKLTQEFMAIDAIVLGQYRAFVPEFGSASVGASLAVAELATDEGPGLELRLGARPEAVLPRELSLYSRMRFGPGIWSAYEFGAQWLLL